MIPLRPHHVLCAIGYQGHGYSDVLVANMNALIMGRLRTPTGPEEQIRITCSADAICAPCPNRVGAGCAMQAKIDALDHRHAERLDLEDGTILTWGEAYERALDRVQPEDLETLCAGCQWLPLGTCKDALAKAQADRAKQKAAPSEARPVEPDKPG